jgi:ABC-2 type transport system permease protein
VRLVLHQARYDLLALLRNRQARYATLVLPLLLAVVLTSVFGEQRNYIPGLAALAVISSSFVNLVISVVVQRETGVLKRRRATPVPAAVLIAGRALTAAAVSLAVASVLVAVGALAFGVHVAPAALPDLAVTALAGTLCFCALGYALSTLIRSADAAQPTLQALMLPLYLVSGILVPATSLPSSLHQLAGLLPVERLADAFHAAYHPAIAWADLAILGAWAAAGLMVALRRFSWTPI